MSDRNVINISPNTRLQIEKYVNNPGTGEKNVLIKLHEGKTRTNVEQKYDGEKDKFLIRTPTAVAGVRGTQFLVSFDPSSQMTRVVTLRGAVSFAPAGALAEAAASVVVVRKGEETSLAPGAAAPEPPKALPRDEIRRIDQETTASSARPSPSQESSPISQQGKGADRSGRGPEDSVEGAGRKDVAKENSGGARGPAASGAQVPPSGGMIDKKDLDADLVKQIPRTPSSGGPGPGMSLPPRPPPFPSGPPRVNPTIGDVIEKQPQRTKVKITPSFD
jgi:hypothetical protein